ncbi:MAG: DUF3445 domain-containing protein [Pseudomonadota bacterium]
MPPWLLDHAPYTPFMDPRTAHPPGLSPLDLAEWTPIDPDFAAQMAYRAELIRDRRDIVLQIEPAAETAVAELYDFALENLRGRIGYAIDGAWVTRPDGVEICCDPARPLETLGALVADDFCVLLPDAASGEYALRAALLCFPSRWSLSEKIGRPLTPIHAPVAEYDETLARRVNRLFEAIRPERSMVRVNWLIHPTCELHLPLGENEKLAADANPEDGIYLRTERQTLTRLPQTGAVVFGIKTSICEIGALKPAEALVLRREFAAKHTGHIAYAERRRSYEIALERLGAIAAEAEAQDDQREPAGG